MTIRRAGCPPRGRAPNADVYASSFVARAHELMVLGFRRLNAASLAAKAEEAITGLLVGAMQEVIDEAAGALVWAARFCVKDDPPVKGDDASLEGRRRNRIDIEIEHAVRGPHPRFRVEAKRLYTSKSASSYTGEDGLGALVSGHYGSEFQQMGMLGYVQTPTRERWTTKVAVALEARRVEHRIPEGPAWRAHRLGPWEGFLSSHVRGDASLHVYHSFFVCCAEPPPSPRARRRAASPGR